MKLVGNMRRAKKRGDRKSIKNIRRTLKLIYLEKKKIDDNTFDAEYREILKTLDKNQTSWYL